ncbi:MAG: Flagellar biosynthesis/type secretory pathway lipoprotein-like protein [Phycisphaerales bacterium]|nr:Flagellar biosynthesis/type secretory pathway lipoprotein-like protein [Phycisphaerales bacterium]
MDLFKAQIDRIQKQLAGLTPSQRMLTAALVAIMVMTLVWWGRYAGEPEMEALLPQAISADELSRVLIELDAKGIKHTMSGDRLLVPSDRKLEALAGLMYSHALPRSAKEGFDEVLKNINPLSSQSSNDEIWNKAKEGMAAQLIRDFPGVADAQVMMDPHQVVRIVGGIDSSASVAIKMQPGSKSTSQLVDAAADVVQGALSSLSRRNIRVVVDGVPRRPHLETDPTNDPGDQLEMVKAAETHLEEKVQKQLHYMPGMTVSVTVHLNTSREHLNSTTYDPKGVVSKEYEIKQKTDENTPAVANSGEPGVSSNLSAPSANVDSSINGGGAGSSNHDETETKIQNSIPKTDIDRVTPPGEATPLSAAVSIPLSYFANIYTRENPGVKDPTETQMQSLIDRKLPEMRHQVASCTGLKVDTDVAIETYMDPAPVTEAAVPAATTGLSVSLLAGGHVKEIALAGLAMVSLFMVSMVVRKGAPAQAVAVAMPAGPAPAAILVSGEALAGEAGGGDSLLDAVELDEDAVRAQQMLDQVTTMVKENPESAATLVKRWLNRT